MDDNNYGIVFFFFSFLVNGDHYSLSMAINIELILIEYFDLA